MRGCRGRLKLGVEGMCIAFVCVAAWATWWLRFCLWLALRLREFLPSLESRANARAGGRL